MPVKLRLIKAVAPVTTWLSDAVYFIKDVTNGNKVVVTSSTGVPEQFSGLQGPPGADGADGAPGPPGPPGDSGVYVQQTRPTATGPWTWWQTDASGNIIDLIVNDGNP